MAAVSGNPVDRPPEARICEASAEAEVQSSKQIPREKALSEGSKIGMPHPHLVKDQGRSFSMPLIEHVGDCDSKSLLQKRAHAANVNLRLPSFTSLGIALPHPEHLLTPPHEPDLAPSSLLKFPDQISQIPLSAPATVAPTMASTNQATPPQDFDTTTACHGSANDASTPRAEAVSAPETMSEATSTEKPIPVRHPSSSSDEDTPRERTWLETAVDATVNDAPRSGPTGNVVTALCHTQPCPISDDLGPKVTALTSILEALQATVGSGKYIDVTHAVPPRFNMSRLPASPMGTPNPNSGEMDYFSMNVFARAAVAADYNAAASWPVPSSPRPVAATDTVDLALMERYIPPSTSDEYVDLFNTERPSALVDRLREISPDGGRLLFIYPTQEGATKFASKYLAPLLDPLLRSLVSIHGLTTDLSHDIGKMVAVDNMYPFAKMERKIRFMLPRLRNNPSSPTVQRKYTLVQASKRTVQMDREVWTEWWLQQEAPRIKEVVRRYYKRGSRLPEEENLTAGALARKILDGVKAREYGPYDEARDGVEVGIFVIQRTA